MHTTIFLHIPKTAGTTLQTIMRRQYPSDQFLRLDGQFHDLVARLEAMPAEERAKVRLLQGHFYYGLHRWLEQPCTYFTFLRDPLRRVYSFYHFVRRSSDHYLHQRAHQYSIEEFIERGFTRETNNWQVRMLNERDFSTEHADDLDLLYQTALENLARDFPVIGLVEAFDESLLMLGQYFGWERLYYHKQNVAYRKDMAQSLPEHVQKFIREHNAYDEALYHAMQGRFARQKEAQGRFFSLRHHTFKVGNHAYGMISRLRARINRAERSL